MKLPSKAWLLAGLLSLPGTPVLAQDYPSKPIHLIVPAGAGTSTDLIVRLFGDGLARELKQPVIVENKTGASGNIAHEWVARAAPDGYTLIGTNTGPLSINKALYSKLPFDPIKDFTPIAFLGYTPTLLVVRSDAQWKTLAELIDYASRNPGKVTYASAGNGTTGHLAGELLKSMSKTDMTHIPYKEGAQAVASVLGGQTDFMFYHPAVIMPYVTGGKMRALGLSSIARSAAAPGIVPLAEQGYAGFDLTGWWGIAAPSGTSAALVGRLVEASQKVIKSAPFVAQLANMGIEPLEMTQPQFAQYAVTELDKWSGIVKLSGAHVD
ncbi:tripartite tricarboxylate transporter substrate binding protein [soil metagenome]